MQPACWLAVVSFLLVFASEDFDQIALDRLDSDGVNYTHISIILNTLKIYVPDTEIL